MVKQVKRFSGKKTKKSVTSGVVHINSTFNNTIVNITDKQGNTICWASAGGSGFKGAKKSTPFAAQSTAEKVATIAYEQGMREAEIVITEAEYRTDWSPLILHLSYSPATIIICNTTTCLLYH